MSDRSAISRRGLIRGGVASFAALSGLAGTRIFAADAAEGAIPFLDPQPIDPKRPMLRWENLTDWITPDAEFFAVSHYGMTKVAADSWRLRIDGLTERTAELSLDEIRSRPRRELTATLECSGNGASPSFMGAVGNTRWVGTPLAPLLKEHGIRSEAVEVAFYGADQGTEKIRGQDYRQNFARTLSVERACAGDVLLAWEMNGRTLAPEHGFPLRLIVPGWYGIAWVKWLTRIELRDRRLMNRFMARDYVTIRGHRNGNTIEWRESSVGPLNVKSLVGRVTRLASGAVRITGAAWSNAAISSVELKIDDGPWRATRLEPHPGGAAAWTFWSCDWPHPSSGEHTLVCRATDAAGNIQPAADDDTIRLKRTYWEANQQYPRRIRV